MSVAHAITAITVIIAATIGATIAVIIAATIGVIIATTTSRAPFP